MRLTVCALSAVLLSGCSWLGMGGHSGSSYGNSGVYGANCGAGYAGGMNAAGYGAQGYGQGGAGCGAAGGYSVAGAGYGAGAGMNGAGYGGAGFGQAGYGAGAAGYGQAGYSQAGYGAGYGASGYGAGMNGLGGDPRVGFGGAYGTGIYGQGGAYGLGGAGGVTTLGANAPYGAAVGGATGMVAGQQYAGGAYGGNVTTVQGSPIYVPQPYPSYYGVPQLRAVGGGFGGALPFGLEAGIGTDFGIGGDIFPGEEAKGNVSSLDAISYKDAYKEDVSYDMAATYDLDRDTTLLARIGYAKAEGQNMLVGTVTDGSVTEDLYAEFSDLEQVTLEGGVRKYVGGWSNPVAGFRPYVGATGGFTHTSNVNLTQSSDTLVDPHLFTQQYVDGGWSPTASGVVGAEWQVGARTALGVETGIRWTDDLDTNFQSDDRWSVPVRLRGRVSF